MRALTISEHGGLERLEYRTDLPVPALHNPTDVRVRIHGAALNHLDLFVVHGLPGVTITPPWIMGADGAGVVEEVGSAVRELAVGDHVVINPGISDRTCEYCRRGEPSLCVHYRILGEHLPGTLADYVVVPAVNLRVVPPDTPWDIAAAFSLATLTAWRMVVTRARVREGETVLIWGIGGGVAAAALQVARLQGARVWVTSGSDAKLARARELGAEETFNHASMDVAHEVRARTGKRGVDVVIDNVGQATWTSSLRALCKGGRLVTCGATTGPMVETDVRRLFWNQWTIMGSTMGNDREYDDAVRAFRSGALIPPIDSVYSMREGVAAFERLASGEHFGKVVIRVAEPGD
ncbi:MAG TPA: zinc-binding dehydrogenase [Gemmatimonadaceae bacterium]|nr:zinc-binding dehydrogenase [Gemmatimonadaceae bacterium]